jgi:Protein of unknown function (DUF1573)
MFSRRWLVGSCLVALAVAPTSVWGQEWARKMFQDTKAEFGTVALGSKTEHIFEFTNLYKEDVHVASVRTSCNCTIPSVEVANAKSWEKGAIKATFNTAGGFVGQRGATVTVTFDKPYFAEVQLSVSGFIRNDVVFNPGSVNFVEVDKGVELTRAIAVEYAGRSDWRITDVRSGNPNFEVELKDPILSPGKVRYEMHVKLKGDAPEGRISDYLSLITNDSATSSVKVPVEGRVVAPLTVSPQSLVLGTLKAGETIKKVVVVKARTPFKVLKVKCEHDCFEIKPDSDEAKTAHIIPVTFTAGDTAVEIAQNIEIITDLGKGATAICKATASVVSVEIPAETKTIELKPIANPGDTAASSK